jgi:hypothetical protein
VAKEFEESTSWPELLSQFPILEKSLEAMGVLVWAMVYFEADDALAGRARLDTSRLEPMLNPVRTKRTLEYFLRRRVELRHIERATNRTVLAPDAFFVIEVNDTVFVLDDGPLCGTGGEASRVGAMRMRCRVVSKA